MSVTATCTCTPRSKDERAAKARAYVRELLAAREPEFAAALEEAVAEVGA